VSQAGASAAQPPGKLGILGGTFDPPHYGHLLLGECAREQFALDRVLFIPAGNPYRKADRPVTASLHRLAMTGLAVTGNAAFAVDDREVRRAGPSYTVDTLRELRHEHDSSLVLILGADALADLPRWREPAAIVALAEIVVAAKGRGEEEVARLAAAAGVAQPPPVVAMPAYPVSSTLIRERLAGGRSARYLAPDAVLAYAAEHGLYRPRA
jgi:nicotinate-nucleotide adenylyltransferase